MTDRLLSLVLLKYVIVNGDTVTWHSCKSYPPEVQAKWAWRCAADVEHFTKGHPEAEKCVEVAKKFRGGMATEGELAAAAATALRRTPDTNAYFAVLAVHAAAESLADAVKAVRTAYYAAHYAHTAAIEQDRKWDLYINWLIEELCAWEEKRALTSREAVVDQ